MGKESSEEAKRGVWTEEENQKLLSYVQKHGEKNWNSLPKQAGLKRTGKSCRLRYANYLRPGIKRGHFSPEEEDQIIKLQATLGNKWATIARHLYRRTDNEIKNYWNSRLKKRVAKKCLHDQITVDDQNSPNVSVTNNLENTPTIVQYHQDNNPTSQACSTYSSTSTSSTAKILNLIASNAHLLNINLVLQENQTHSPQSTSLALGDDREMSFESMEFHNLIPEFQSESSNNKDGDFDDSLINDDVSIDMLIMRSLFESM